MKKTLVIASLAVLSTSAYASKARMQALGQGTESFYLNDTRSVFLNPASLNDTKNYIVTEWGTGRQADADSAPRAEGGFFREMGSFSYGLYLGNNGAGRTSAASPVITDGAFVNHQNALDLVLAGDMGVKWGARVHYAGSKDESEDGSTATAFEKKNTAFGLGLGVIAGDAEGYANVDLTDKSTGATVAGDEWKRKPSFQVGGSYKWSGNTFFADYSAGKEELTKGSGSTLDTWTVNTIGTATAATLAASNTHKTTSLTVGAARIHEVNPTARIVTDARLNLASDDVGAGKVKSTTLPLTFALEADATSWLVLRGSVSQNVILGSTKSAAGKTTSVANSAVVNGGATLNFGKLKVDGLVGTTETDGTTNTKNGVLSTSNLMTRVAVSYWF